MFNQILVYFATIYRKLKHCKHIVTPIAFARDDTKLYVVSKWYRDGNLSMLQNHTRVQDKMRFVISLVIGVYELHENGYIHRDIKPANVLIKVRLLELM